ncbi:MAG: hypothetical protein LBD30_03410, partial [Verrucomicrobiales bacterium]|nr:hypothetical protein [Verrucomicrobiales bacterium]
MKTNKLTKWAALLAVIGGLAALPLTVSAALKYVDSGTVIESGSVYAAVSGTSALTVTGSGVAYNGTALQLSSSFTDMHGARVADQAALTLVSSTISTNGVRSNALSIGVSSVATLNGLHITVMGINSIGVLAREASLVTIDNSVINTSGSGNDYGLIAKSTSRIIATKVVINSSGTRSLSVVADTGGYVEVNDSEIHATGLVKDAALVPYNGGFITLNNTTVDSITRVLTASGNSSVIINNSVLEATGTCEALAVSDSDLTVSGGTVSANGNNSLIITGTSISNVTLNDVVFVNADDIVTNGTFSGTARLTIGGAITSNITSSGSGTLAVNVDSGTLTGDITAVGAAAVVVNLDNGAVFNGLVSPEIPLSVINNSTWNLAVNATVNDLNVANGGKVVFQTAGGYKTLTVGNLTGNNGEFHMNTDI